MVIFNLVLKLFIKNNTILKKYIYMYLKYKVYISYIYKDRK